MANKDKKIIQSIAGIPIPPRKVLTAPPGKQPLVLRFALKGSVPSKKNNYTAERNIKKLLSILKVGEVITPEMVQRVIDVKPYVRNSERYKKWAEKTRPILAEQAAKWLKSYEKHGLKFPIKLCKISYYIYWKDRIIRDNSNKHEGFDDLFVELGIIAGDGYDCLRKGEQEADCYRDELTYHLTTVFIVAYDW